MVDIFYGEVDVYIMGEVSIMVEVVEGEIVGEKGVIIEDFFL